MKQAFSTVLVAILLVWGRLATAAETVWLQIEAQPSLREAEDRARAYAGQFSGVAGFRLSSGWYAIVLGPVDALDAERRLANLRGLRQIPGDSFVADGGDFRAQFWPVGATTAIIEPPTAPEPLEVASAEQIDVVAPVLQPIAEETPAEARRTEAALSREDRQLLQTAMQWQGYYDAAIDGDFGPGTRNAMAAWQGANGYEATGILTTAQRDRLVGEYRADLAALGLEPIHEPEAGIDIQLPTALVTFDHYDPPFVHFKQKDGSGVSVLLISQAGDRNTLFGLYDIMQTLEIVPPNGERSRSDDSFTLTGQSAGLNSYTYAALQGGLVKGYTLVWKPQDDARMARVLAAMQSSFAPFGDRAMDDTVGTPTDDQRRGMLAGLEVRRPAFSRSGFYIDAQGTVLTTLEAVQSCGRITLDSTVEADVALRDAAIGFAVLKPRTPLSPMAVAEFQTAVPRLQAEIAVSGYSYEDQLPLPTLTFGALEDLRGLNGEASLRRLALAALPGDAGGPVFDSSGAVLGMLLPQGPAGGQSAGGLTAGRVLPEGVNFAANAQSISAALTQAGIAVAPNTRQGGMPAEELTTLATGMTVMVSCWN